jgi:DNA-binding NtrC family response regulator
MAKILVIDDDPGFRKMINLTLTRAQHQVIEAQDGNEGLLRFKTDRPDLVISDIVMPEKDGIATILEIKTISPAMPIIAMSGGGTNIGMQYLGAAGKLGADSILPKPFRPADLLDLVNRMLADRRMTGVDI